jgi:hypothetical protein
MLVNVVKRSNAFYLDKIIHIYYVGNGAPGIRCGDAFAKPTGRLTQQAQKSPACPP